MVIGQLRKLSTNSLAGSSSVQNNENPIPRIPARLFYNRSSYRRSLPHRIPANIWAEGKPDQICIRLEAASWWTSADGRQ